MLSGSIEYVCRKYNVISGENRLYIDLGRETHAQIKPNIEGRGRGMYLYEGVLDIELKHNQIKPQLQT